MIDCGGSYQVWGCECPHCIGRDHPLDRTARFTPEQKAEFARLASLVDRTITRDCVSCRSPETRSYPGGWFCEEHKP